MNNERQLMQYHFVTNDEISVHYHQNIEIFYILRGKLDIKIDESMYHLNKGDIILINANKRHSVTGKENLLGARFEIDFHLLAEYMGTLQLMFWCNTVIDKNDAYKELRQLFDRILERYFEKNDKAALYLNALYYETLYILTSNFMVKADDVRLDMEHSQDRIRIKQIQNYIQANYQKQISLNDLADRLYLSNAYLSKYIKKHLGLTFLEYLNNVRLFHAVDELLYTNKSITHIAMDNGFPTSAAFTKIFRDIHGESPSEYRKKMQIMQKQDEKEENLNEKDRTMLLEYLNYRQNRKQPEKNSFLECFADVRHFEKQNWNWFKAINAGEAYSLLQSDVQEQLREIQKETGMIYARIWNVFEEGCCLEEKGNYNFRKLDLVLDFIIDNHMKPYIELGVKPSLLMYTVEKTITRSANKKESNDFETFKHTIKALCMHLINRYGLEEVESWYFEFWNDPKLCMSQENGEYYKYFEHIYITLKEIAPEAKIGGAGFVLGYENPVSEEIFKVWSKRSIHPDFISFCSYQYVAMVNDGIHYGRKSIDGHYMKNQITIIRELMKSYGFVINEVHVDEWNFTLSNRNVLNDSCEQGAYILKNCIDMADEIDCMAYWHSLDSYSEYYDSHQVLNGDSGIISRDGIKKPSFYAFQFMGKLQPNIIKRDEYSIITTNGRGKYTIACHNFKKLSSKYVFSEEDQIKIDDLEWYMEDTDPLNLKFCLDNIRNGSYQVKIYYMNKDNGSAQDIWRKMEYAKNLSKDEISYIQKRAMPSMEMRTVQVENGLLELENILMAQEIRLIEIQYRYSV